MSFDNRSSFDSVDLEAATSTFQSRSAPDVPEDVDLLLEHVGDPNMDLSQFRRRPSRHPEAIELEFQTRPSKAYTFSVTDVASHIETATSPTVKDIPIQMPSTSQEEDVDFNDESPYPEVRAAVSSVDDPDMPVNTFRMWFLGIFFSIVVSAFNQVLAFRYPSVFITGIVIQLISLPFGKTLEIVLPPTRFKTLGYIWSFNPGPFSIKEHVCITFMANVSVVGAYATEVLASQQVFYKQSFGYEYQILLALGTQVLGFSLGGILRKFVVWPSSMIWPGALVNCALFNTLHKNYRKHERRHMSRERFFTLVFIGSFVWYWFPGYIFTALSMFNWVCWIVPNNVAVNALFGTSTGLGMGVLTFDWSMITYIGSPLVTPWWSTMNTMVSFFLWFWIAVPIIYFTNAFNTAYLPISSYLAFDNTGLPYDPTLIVTDSLFDVEKYRSYSPAFVSATLILGYATSFAAFSSVIVHTFLWFRFDIARRIRGTLKDQKDVHSRLMLAYAEVPGYWYGLVGGVSFICLAIAIQSFDTKLPVWAAALAFFIAAVLSVPLAMIQAITNQQVTLQVLHEMVAGYMLPGRPIANVIFKTIAYMGTNQAIGFAGDLKLGHYMKVPPRIMFITQVVAVVITCFVSTGIQTYMLANVVDICTPDQPNGFICPSTTTFSTASLLWGGIGPQRLFSPGAPYAHLLWFFLLGAVLPIPFYFLARRFPMAFFRYVNIPVFFAGVGSIPPATGINYVAWGIAGFFFNFFLRRNHFRWWMRYNYILSAGLDAGVALAMITIFLCLALPNIPFEWWGNTVWINTADAAALPLKMVTEGNVFGPTTWA